jgi:DNA transformation protein and related proteins
MQRDTSFRDFILDQLRDLELLTCRAMFGGYGLYHHGNFFGIISQNRLYFKTTAATREEYERRDMQPFRPNTRQTLKNYYEVPAEIIEDDEQLVAWARAAAQ